MSTRKHKVTPDHAFKMQCIGRLLKRDDEQQLQQLLLIITQYKATVSYLLGSGPPPIYN